MRNSSARKINPLILLENVCIPMSLFYTEAIYGLALSRKSSKLISKVNIQNDNTTKTERSRLTKLK